MHAQDDAGIVQHAEPKHGQRRALHILQALAQYIQYRQAFDVFLLHGQTSCFYCLKYLFMACWIELKPKS